MEKIIDQTSHSVIIKESDMKFGEYSLDNVFLMEESDQHIKIKTHGCKTVEFVLLRKKALLFVEAKTKPRDPYSTEPDAKKKADEYISEIAQKFSDSISLYMSIIAKRQPPDGLSGKLQSLDYEKTNIQFILVINDCNSSILIYIHDKLTSLLCKTKTIWRVGDVLVIDKAMAVKKKLLTE